MTVKILVLLLFLRITNAVENSPLCTDLAKFSCAPGVHDDGTGESENDFFASENIEEIETRKKVKIKATEEFEKILTNSNNKKFRDLSISILGLNGNPECKSIQNKSVINCNKNIVIGLVKLAEEDLFYVGDISTPRQIQLHGDLQENFFFRNQSLFQEIKTEISGIIDKKLIGKNKKIEDKIRITILPDLKKLLIAKIEKMQIEDKMKKVMIDKIIPIEFIGSDCTEHVTSLARHFLRMHIT